MERSDTIEDLSQEEGVKLYQLVDAAAYILTESAGTPSGLVKRIEVEASGEEFSGWKLTKQGREWAVTYSESLADYLDRGTMHFEVNDAGRVGVYQNTATRISGPRDIMGLLPAVVLQPARVRFVAEYTR